MRTWQGEWCLLLTSCILNSMRVLVLSALLMTIVWIEIAMEKGKYDAAAALSLRNTVRDKIAAASLGKFIGGGVSMNGSTCDLEVSCQDAMATERFVRTLLSELCPSNAV